MPVFQPRNRLPPGVEMPQIDKKTQSVMDAFDIVSQQLECVWERMNEIAVVIATVAEMCKEQEGEAKALREEIEKMKKGPYDMLWKGVKYVLATGVGAAIYAYITSKFSSK